MSVYGSGSYSNYKHGRKFAVFIDGKRKFFYGKTDVECFNKYKAYINKNADNVQKSKLDSFATYMYQWYQIEKEPDISGGSAKNYKIYLSKIENSILGTTAIDLITPLMIKQFFNQKEIISLKKKTYLKAIIRGTFEFCIQNDYIYKNPFNQIKIKEEYDFGSSVKIFQKSDVTKILNFARTDEELGTAVLTLLYTGLRRGELCAIYYKDINFKEKYLLVHRAVSRDEVGHYFLNDTTKTKKPRVVPLTDELCERLKQLNKTKCIWNGKEFLSPATFENAYRRFFKHLNETLDESEKVDYLSPHKMRHTFGTNIYKGSNDLRGLQVMLGHSRSTTTEIYTHIDTEDERKILEKITY